MRATPRRPLPAVLLLAAVATAAMAVLLPVRPAAADGADLRVVSVDAAGAPTVSATVELPATMSGADTFTVAENGEARPARVRPLAGDSLETVLVIDTSGSMRGPALDAAKAAATAFLVQMPASAPVAVVAFGDTPTLTSPLTTDRAALGGAIARLGAGGETALYDAVGLALDQYHPGDRIRHHMVLLSDGGDTASTTALDAARQRLASAGVRLDVAELTTAESRREPLLALAEAGGGTVMPAADPAALTSIFHTLGRGLANQYVVETDTQGRGTTRLRITVERGGQRATADVSVTLPAGAKPATAAPPAPTAEETAAAPARSWTSTAPMLAAGAALCFLALLLAASLLPGRRAPRAYLAARPCEAGLPVLAALSQRAIDVADLALERHDRRRGVSAALERAGVALRPGEVLVSTGVVSVVVFVVAAVLVNLLVGLLLAVLAVMAAPATVSFLARRRQHRFHEQLGDNLQLMAGSLRSGYAVLQAVDAVAREAESPSADEFRRVTVESRLGRDLNASLMAMADRVGGEDVEWVAQAIAINREVGGNLAEILENVAGTVRERDRVRRQVRVLSAEGRISAIVLVALPVLLTAVMWLMNPAYIGELTHGLGLMLSGLGVVMLAAGSFWMSRLVKVEY